MEDYSNAQQGERSTLSLMLYLKKSKSHQSPLTAHFALTEIAEQKMSLTVSMARYKMTAKVVDLMPAKLCQRVLKEGRRPDF